MLCRPRWLAIYQDGLPTRRWSPIQELTGWARHLIETNDKPPPSDATSVLLLCVVRGFYCIHICHFISFICSVMSVSVALSSVQQMRYFGKRHISSMSLLRSAFDCFDLLHLCLSYLTFVINCLCCGLVFHKVPKCIPDIQTNKPR